MIVSEDEFVEEMYLYCDGGKAAAQYIYREIINRWRIVNI